MFQSSMINNYHTQSFSHHPSCQLFRIISVKDASLPVLDNRCRFHGTCLGRTDRKPPRRCTYIHLRKNVGFRPPFQRLSTNYSSSTSSNAEICPETYCLCSSLAVAGVSQSIQMSEDVYETATYATTEAGGCPSTDAGSPVTTSSKTGSTCVPTPTILPSSTTNRPSSTQPVGWMITCVASP